MEGKCVLGMMFPCIECGRTMPSPKILSGSSDLLTFATTL